MRQRERFNENANHMRQRYRFNVILRFFDCRERVMVAGDSAKHRYHYLDTIRNKKFHEKNNCPETIRIPFLHLSGGVRWGEVWWALPCISGLLLSGNYPDTIRNRALEPPIWNTF